MGVADGGVGFDWLIVCIDLALQLHTIASGLQVKRSCLGNNVVG